MSTETLDDLELSGPSFYGYPPLQKALAAHCSVDIALVPESGRFTMSFMQFTCVAP